MEIFPHGSTIMTDHQNCATGIIPNKFFSTEVPEKYQLLFEWLQRQIWRVKKFDEQSEAERKTSLKMNDDRRQRLVDLGVDVSQELQLDFSWDDYFELLQQYKSEHGDCKYT